LGQVWGRYVQNIGGALEELTKEFTRARNDRTSGTNSTDCCAITVVGQPVVSRSTADGAWGGAQIYLKREDLLHTGAHKINNAIGQALLARRMGKQRIIAETGAGQHGVATATVCALFDCTALSTWARKMCGGRHSMFFECNYLGPKL